MGVSGAATSAGVIVELFNACFGIKEATFLVGGAREPFYEPGNVAHIHFREDFMRSALHEVAHWCVAGKRRHQLPDYGYWYAPDGRSEAQQSAFFSVEARPQAIESIFCDACGVAFAPSVDNVEGGVTDTELEIFVTRITSWRSRFLKEGLPSRAEQFRRALNREFAGIHVEKVTDSA